MLRAIKRSADKTIFRRHWTNQKFLEEHNLTHNFREDIQQTNLLRLKVVVLGGAVFSFVQILLNYFTHSSFSPQEDILLLKLDSIMLFVSIVLGFFAYFTDRNNRIKYLKKFLLSFYILFLLIWAALISNIESIYFQYFPTYSFVVIFIPWFFLTTGRFILFALISGFIVLFFGYHILPGIEKHPDIYYQIAIAFTFISWIISRTLYHNREQTFVSQVKLELTNKNLEKRVQERTNELTEMNVQLSHEILQRKKYEDSLIEAKHKAEESDRLKSTFLANMSHEIRTPMNGIIGFSSLLQRKNLSEEKTDRYLTMIQNNCQQLLVIIDDILDLSKIEANQITLKEVNIESKMLLTEIIEVFNQYKKYIKKDHLQLGIENKSTLDDLHFIGDVNRLQQILNNFMRNAIKFTDEGSIRTGVYRKENKLVFYVSDDGVGIPESKREYIFDRFYQVDDSPVRKQGGAGLGLAISKGLADLMQGDIWFDSIENKGTTFYLSIPYKPVKIINKTGSSKESQDHSQSIIISHRHILIVEDDFASFHYLKEILNLYNATISHAINGNEAVEMCKLAEPLYDLVLMDLQLPEMNGFEASKKIRELFPELPIMAQTANLQFKENDTELFDNYIFKPINESELISKIIQTLKDKDQLSV